MELTVKLAVLILFLICLAVQLYFILFIHIRLRKYKIKETVENFRHPVSVIICARNEFVNLQKNLLLVLEQDYPDFEVVVVNDCSFDESDLLLKEYAVRYKNLKVVTLNEHVRFKHGKKFAVTMGIKAAVYEHLLFTDADCRPASTNWLLRMQQHFNKNVEIVLGYSPYQKLPGFVNRLIRFETFYTALNYLSYALSSDAYMGVGRNLAYTKALFFKGKGFASHMHIPSGDDDLFVNQNAAKANTVIEIHPEAQVWTEPKKTFSSYFNQKLRHLGAGKVYKKKHQFSLSLQVVSATLFYVLLITLIFLKASWQILVGAYLLRLIVQLLIYFPILKKLSYKDLFLWFAAFDLFYYFYIIAVSSVSLFKKKVQWR
ncbi:glycosyltransferase [Rubrolithibacter danxiaensis]|uniref:glycosyltransferase n=1 Tax=Rubrolithibacter danxiaensis TaxID=3390805 RepID=UPI003BF8F336